MYGSMIYGIFIVIFMLSVWKEGYFISQFNYLKIKVYFKCCSFRFTEDFIYFIFCQPCYHLIMLKSFSAFLKYWYFRYLLVTELYMVEKWERAMFHIVIFLLLSILYLFNTTVTMGVVRMITDFLFNNEFSSSEYIGTTNNNYNEL